MMYLKDMGIEDYIRSEVEPDTLCKLKIKGEWKDYKMVTDEYDWLEVVIPLESGVYHISVLDIMIMLGRM